MNIDQCRRGEQLLVEASSLLKNLSDSQSQEKAFELVLQAVNLGVVRGYSVLAQMYERGIGTKRSMSNAVKYYALAATHGDTNANRRWGWLTDLEGFLWHRVSPYDRR